MRQYMVDQRNAWKNGRMVWDGSHTVPAEQLLRVSNSVEFWGGGRCGRVQKPLKTFTVPEGKPFSICLWLETSWKENCWEKEALGYPPRPSACWCSIVLKNKPISAFWHEKMLELGSFCFSRSICGKTPNLLTQPELRWLLYNCLNCYTAKDRLILHRSSPSVPLFWLPVACGIHGHGCNDPRQRPVLGLRQPAYKPCGSPLATAHTLVQYEEDIKPSPTCFPAPSGTTITTEPMHCDLISRKATCLLHFSPFGHNFLPE